MYAERGLPGLLRVLPPRATATMMAKFRHHRPARRSFGDAVWEFVTSPEKMLVVLLAAFAVLVLLDSRSNANNDMMSLQSLQHVHPFPMMPGMTLTSSS